MASNPNDRPLKVITFLAAHPTEVFTLAEIGHRLEISKGSAHRVMAALVDAGFVSRHPRHKTYSLGLSLVAIGQATLERYPGINRARQEMLRLSAELNVGCAATAIVNDEYILLCREGVPKSYDGLTLVGEKHFVVPPIGVGQFAWRSEEEVEAYLHSGRSYMNATLREHLRTSFGAIRNRGYSMSANGSALNELIRQTLVPENHKPEDGLLKKLEEIETDIPLDEIQLLEWSDVTEKGLNYIAAPVFSSEGNVSFELVISGFPLGMATEGYNHCTERLISVTEVLTKEIRGYKPNLVD